MKKFNLFAMGLLAAATVSFTACSSNDDLSANGNNSSESKADGFYMTLTVQSPTSTRTRTVGEKTEAGSDAETIVNTGTLFLVDQNGKTVFSKEISASDWNEPQTSGTNPNGTLKTIKLEVNLVTAGSTYNVYFLANTTYPTTENDKTINNSCWTGTISTPWENDVYSNLASADENAPASKFSYAFSMNNYFAMFNQNDPSHDGKKYTVTFTEENKTTPAKVLYNQTESNILLDRIVARIDQPTSTVEKIADPDTYTGEASETYKEQMQKAYDAVSEIALQKYAISNLPTSTYAMQHWDANGSLVMPSTGFTYQQDYDSFGDETKANGLGQFVTWAENGSLKNYVLENAPVADADAKTSTELNHKCTAMYFQYKVTLKEITNVDFSDGTFYRYNGVIYTKLADIFTAYKNVTGWKGLPKLTKDTDGKYTASTTDTYSDAATAVTDLKDCVKDEANLSTLRQAWGIEVFCQGLCYYKQIITDQNYKVNAIHRNTIYKLQVNNIFNIGADVPNGTPTENAVYYMNVGITANQWVMSTQQVNFQ